MCDGVVELTLSLIRGHPTITYLASPCALLNQSLVDNHTLSSLGVIAPEWVICTTNSVNCGYPYSGNDRVGSFARLKPGRYSSSSSMEASASKEHCATMAWSRPMSASTQATPEVNRDCQTGRPAWPEPSEARSVLDPVRQTRLENQAGPFKSAG